MELFCISQHGHTGHVGFWAIHGGLGPLAINNGHLAG